MYLVIPTFKLFFEVSRAIKTQNHGSKAKGEGLRLVNRLREAGFRAIMGFGDRSLKAQMREADREKVEYTLILGEEERRKGKITVREMASSQEAQVETGHLEEWLRERLEGEE